MSSLLREMRRAAAGMSLEVTLECTHHGPLLTTPTCYVEVGSDVSGWQDAEAAAAVARAILACDPSNRPVAIGFGGGGYGPPGAGPDPRPVNRRTRLGSRRHPE